jgi:hypothetical protein
MISAAFRGEAGDSSRDSIRVHDFVVDDGNGSSSMMPGTRRHASQCSRMRSDAGRKK